MHFKTIGGKLVLRKNVVPHKYLKSPANDTSKSILTESEKKRKLDILKSFEGGKKKKATCDFISATYQPIASTSSGSCELVVPNSAEEEIPIFPKVEVIELPNIVKIEAEADGVDETDSRRALCVAKHKEVFIPKLEQIEPQHPEESLPYRSIKSEVELDEQISTPSCTLADELEAAHSQNNGGKLAITEIETNTRHFVYIHT